MSEFIFKLPDLGEGTVESEIGEWNVKVGDMVEEESIVGTMMTDKAAVELSSPVTGKVVSLAGEPGDMVSVGAPLIVFETDSAEAPAESVEKSVADDTEQSPAAAVGAADQEQARHAANGNRKSRTQKQQTDNKIITSPAIRRRAKEAGIDLADITGSGTSGRILRNDFDDFLKAHRSGKPLQSRPTEVKKATEVKVIGLRRIIAERMSAANREIPHFSYVEEVDITSLNALRQHLNGKKAQRDERLTLLPFVGLALIRALDQFPQCNTTYDSERNVLLRHAAVHLGIAAQTPDGLKVPVVRNAERLSLDGLAAEIRRLSEAARDNTAAKDELQGSTITVTSLGKLGGVVSTPVINMPEVSIIGVNKAVERPMVVDGKIAVRLMMNLSSSFDHRFVDGYDAAAMIQRIKELLEHPATMFMS